MDRKLFELVLVVKNVEAAVRFYRDAVGLEPIGVASDEWAGFWVGERETNAWLGLRRGKLLYEEFSKLPEGSRFGPAHFALRVPVEKKPEALLRLARHAVTVYGPEVWEPGTVRGGVVLFLRSR